MKDYSLYFDEVSFRFPDGVSDWLLHNFSLALSSEQVTILLGRSGCGKTTLLNLLAGVLRPTFGKIQIDNGGAVAELTTGMVFQSPTLLPWRDVADNAAFGLELDGRRSAEARRALAIEALAEIGLAGHAKSYPRELSGGMQQRVALLRAVLPQPSLLLLDEPFSSLDFVTKRQIQLDLARRIAESGCLVVLVTHDLDDALMLGDRIVIVGDRPLAVLDDFHVPFSRESRLREEFDPSSSLSEYRKRIWSRWSDEY